MRYSKYIKIVTLAVACLVMMSVTSEADELTLIISTVDTFRVDAGTPSMCGALAVPTVPTGDSIYIDYAELIIPISADADTKNPLMLQVAPIKSEWTPGSITPSALTAVDEGYDPHVGGILPVGESITNGEVRINVTSMVTLWQQGKLSNLGLLILPISENESSFSITKDGRYNGGHAKLRIVYCKP